MEVRTLKLLIKDVSGQKKIRLVEIEGAWDSQTIEEAERTLSSLLNNGDGKYIIVDCSKLNYINTTGLVFLMKYYIRCKRRNGGLKIVNPNKTFTK